MREGKSTKVPGFYTYPAFSWRITSRARDDDPHVSVFVNPSVTRDAFEFQEHPEAKSLAPDGNNMEILTVDELAELLKMSKKLKINGNLRFLRKDVDSWLAKLIESTAA